MDDDAAEDQLFAAVRHVLTKHDPEGLLAIGAPGDEYDTEAAELAALVRLDEPPMEAAVEQVWRRCFGERHHLRSDRLRAVTDDLRYLRQRFLDV